MLVLFGFFCKQTNGTVQQYYLTAYFKDNYGASGNFDDYVNGATFGSLVLIPLQAVVFGFIVDCLSKKSDMTVPLFVAYKATCDIIANFLIFGQSNFNLAMIGVYINFLMCKGFFGIVILTLKTVVDEKVASISVSFALLSVNLNILLIGTGLGKLS